jgi:hypothetical protein
MTTWGVGYPLGIATGLFIGLVYARKQKTWSELSSKERKIRIGLIAVVVVLLVTGIVMMLVT